MNGATLVELTNELGFAKSRIHSHRTTLESNKYVVRNEDVYELSLQFLDHEQFVKNSRDISRLSSHILEDVAVKTGEVAWLIVEEHGETVYLNKAMGENVVQTHARIGSRAYFHYLTTGKLILAYLIQFRAETGRSTVCAPPMPDFGPSHSIR